MWRCIILGVKPGGEGLDIATYYSNAELSALFPTLNDLREILQANGDDSFDNGGADYNPKNLQIINILGTFLVKNYHIEFRTNAQQAIAYVLEGDP